MYVADGAGYVSLLDCEELPREMVMVSIREVYPTPEL